MQTITYTLAGAALLSSVIFTHAYFNNLFNTLRAVKIQRIRNTFYKKPD